MKQILLLVVTAALVAGCHRQPAAVSNALPDDLLQPYLKIHEGLTKDSVEGLSANAAAISAAAARLGPTASAVDASARKLQQATTLVSAREQFGTLSESLVAYMKGQGRRLPDGVRQAWCPMAMKPWVQRGSMIANPYYGKEMPTCGEFK